MFTLGRIFSLVALLTVASLSYTYKDKLIPSVPTTQVANVISTTQSNNVSTQQETLPASSNQTSSTTTDIDQLISSKLDTYVKQGKFRGPKGDRGDRGEKGQDGKPGQNGSSGISTSYTTPTGVAAPVQNLTVSYTPPGASNPGSIGAISYFSSSEINSGKLTVSGESNLNTLNVSGNSTLTSLSSGSVLPTTGGTLTNGFVTTAVVTGLASNFYDESQKYIAVGSDGFVRFVYMDDNFTTVKFVQCLDQDCTTKTTTTVATDANNVDTPTIAIGSDGFARISYMTYDTPNELHFIRCANASCSTKVDTLVDTSTLTYFYFTSITIGPDGFARIAYDDFTYGVSGLLRLAVCNDADCTAPTLTTVATSGDYTEGVSLAVAPDGFARIAYADHGVSPVELHFVQCTNTSCSTKTDTVVDTSSGMYYLDLVVASDGFGRIGYGTADQGYKFTQCTNATCSTKTITILDINTDYDQVSIALDSDDLPRIVYATNTEVTYIKCNNASCSSRSTKEINSDAKDYTSMVMGLDDYPRIIYRSDDSRTLYLTRLTTDDGLNIISGSSLGGSGNAFGNIFSKRLNADELYLNGTAFDPNSHWISTSSNNIYYDLGNVGIGTSTPQTKLAVNGGFSVGTNWLNSDTAYGFQVADHGNSFSESIIHAQSQILGLYANPQGYGTLGTSGITYPAQSSGLIAQLGTPLVLGANGVEAMRIETNGGVGIGYKRSYSFTRSVGENVGDTVNIGSLSGVGNGQIYFTLYLSGGSCNGLGQANAKYEFISQYDVNTGGWQELAPFQSTKTLTRNFVAVDVNHPGGFGPVQIRIRQIINTGINCMSHIGHLEVYNESANFTPSTSTGTGGTVNGQYSLNPITQVDSLVGIATTSPWKSFSVTGTVAFDGLTSGAGAGSLCLSANKEVTYSAGATCTVSSGRFKHDIATSTTGLDFVNKLRPVTFKYNEDIGVPGEQFGFIAEEVEQLDPRLVVHDKDNKPFSVRYENLTATLVKAIQEQQIQIDDIKTKVGISTSTVIVHDVSGPLSIFTGEVIDFVVRIKEIITDKITATLGVFKRVETEELCVGETCVTETEFKSLLEKNSILQSGRNVDESIKIETPTSEVMASSSESVSTTSEETDDVPSEALDSSISNE